MASPVRVTRREFDVLKALHEEKLGYADAPTECDRLADLGLLKPVFGSARITSSGHFRLAAGPPRQLNWQLAFIITVLAGTIAWAIARL